MDEIEAAIKSLTDTTTHVSKGTASNEEGMFGVGVAQAWAAIAQAEQLKRIADTQERQTELLERLNRVQEKEATLEFDLRQLSANQKITQKLMVDWAVKKTD